MSRYIFLALSLYLVLKQVCSATVDQRQTGELNIQIDLKNLQIVGLMKGKEEYVDYDYAYDYSEMTIKPPSGTKKPLNITDSPVNNKDNTTTTVSAQLDQTDQSTFASENVSLSTEAVPTTSKISNESSTSPTTTTTTDTTASTNTTIAICNKGYFRNSKGSCELKLQNPSNALLKIIKQKLKLHGSGGAHQL